MTDLFRDQRALEIPVGTDVFQAALLEDDPTGWIELESELVRANVPVPLPNRVAWVQAHSNKRHRYLAVRSREGSAEAAAVVRLEGSRAIPGWRIARVERIGPARTEGGRRALLVALSRIPLLEPRVLRLQVGVFAAEAGLLTRCVEQLRALGFRRQVNSRSYPVTLVLPLSPEPRQLFSDLHPTARRHIRAVERKPVRIRPIVDPSFAPRLETLTRETFARTGAAPPDHDWSALIRLSTARPELSRIVGLHEADSIDPSGLLAFAWGCFHGDHAHYAAAASIRGGRLKMPLTYGLMWELILWARARGGRFFDLGGIPKGKLEPGHPLSGIQRFKRYFASEVREVGAEFSLDPSPLLASASRAVSSTGRWLIRGRGKLLARFATASAKTIDRPATRLTPVG